MAAVEDLDSLIRTHSLPADTRARVARSLRALERFPLDWAPRRAGAGTDSASSWAWWWLLLVYVFIEQEDRVVVVTVQDARSSTAATITRG